MERLSIAVRYLIRNLTSVILLSHERPLVNVSIVLGYSWRFGLSAKRGQQFDGGVRGRTICASYSDMIPQHRLLRIGVQVQLLVDPIGDPVVVVALPSYLDFGHFLVHRYAQTPNQAGNRSMSLVYSDAR